MNFKRTAILTMILLAFLSGLSVSAQSKPRWAQKDEKSLNKERSNQGYEFKVFNTYGMDRARLRAERFNPLLTYVREKYNLGHDAISLDSIVGSDGHAVYRMTFPSADGNGVVYARQIDDHAAYEDYVDNTFQFEYYQLYAITEKDKTPEVFDDYEVTRIYNNRATAMSIIPGLGQIYKGQPAKGYTIMGFEAALIATAIATDIKMHHCKRQIDKHPDVEGSWRSKANGWRNFRNISLGLAGGLYVYNILDAALSKGARQVVVKKRRQQTLTFTPVATPEGGGIALTLSF